MSDDLPTGRGGRCRSGRTAAELMAELEADPEWVAARDAEERQLERDEAELRRQQVPLLADLSAVGIHVTDVWDLVNTSEPYPAALPVLVQHLHLDYAEPIREGIARALAVPDAVPFWDQVMKLFRAADPGDVRIYQGLGVALSGMATRSRLAEVRAVLRDRRLGPARGFFLRTLTRLRAPDRWEVIGDLFDDPEIGAEARHLLHQRELRDAARTRHRDRS